MDELKFWVDDGVGYIRLNRPRAINALLRAMLLGIEAQVRAWFESGEVTSLDLSGEGRGYCAGADVRELRNLRLEDPLLAVEFLDLEYRVDALLANSPVPLTAHLHGITMGGGVGLEMRAARRIAASDLQWAMPEVGIGLWPDVGTTYELSRIPGYIGVYLGLTGTTIDAASALYAGVVDEVVEVRGGEDADATTAEVFTHVGRDSDYAQNSQLARDSSWIASCFSADNVVEIVTQLESHADPRARASATLIRERAPLSVAVTLGALKQAETLPNVDAVLTRDSALARTIGLGPDFIEGVRAQLIDKDRTPHWTHASIEEVTPEEVAAILGNR